MMANKLKKLQMFSVSKIKADARYVKKHKWTYIFMLPAIVFTIVLSYIPMVGLYLAFVDYDVFQGFSSPYVGFENIKSLFTVPMFSKAIVNTLKLSITKLVVGFPIPIIFAILLNELKNGFFKRFTQTVSYLPHFLSTVAIIGLVTSLFSNYGIINDIRLAVMGEETGRELWLTKQNLFLPLLVGVDVWSTMGWSSIVYLAAISGIDPSLYEAAIVDGAGKFKQCIYITLPQLANTAIILLILSISKVFSVGFDMVYGLQNVYIDFEVINTIIYQTGINSGNYSMATALGLVQGIIGLALIFITNKIASKVSETSLF